MRKIIYALISVAIALGLWTYVVTVVNPESEETFWDIPVVLQNESELHNRGLMIVSDDIPKVTLKLRGNRTDLVNLNRNNITLTADLSRIYDVGQQLVSYNISYPGNIPNNAFEVLSQNPKLITLTVAERLSKQVPIRVVYEGSVPDNYRTDKENLVLDYQYVQVTGPAEVVSQISYAKVLVNLNGRTESVNEKFSYTLFTESGEEVPTEYLTTDISEVNLALKIQFYKDIQLVVNVIPGGGATLDNTVIQMDMDTIQIAGDKKKLEGMEVLVLGEIFLGEEPTDTTKEFEIILPEGVDNLTGKDKVNVTIEFQNLVSKTFDVTNIVKTAVPETMEVTILTKAMKITVRGPKTQIEQMKASDLTVQVDFSEAEAGTDTYKAVVLVDSEKFAAVGAVGTYSVDAKVTASEVS